MSKLTKSARGMGCQVRLPGICNFNPETTVLAHLGGAGMGMKSLDIHGAFCCSSCHDAYDGRTKVGISRDEIKMYFYDGMVRTQNYWIKNGFLVIK